MARLLGALCALALAAGASARGGQTPAARTFAVAESGGVVRVHVGGELMLELEQGVLLRLRCAPGSERWVGYEGQEVRLGWSPGAHPAVSDVAVDVAESGERLRIVVAGRKPELGGARFTTEIAGAFDGRGRVRYTIASALDLGRDGRLAAVELLDLWYDRIFWPERHRGSRELYQELVFGGRSGALRAPKLHVYGDTAIPGHPAITLTQPAEPGGFFAVAGAESGGVLCRFEELSTAARVEVCWWTWDAHLMLRPPEPVSRFAYRMTVEDLDAREAGELLAKATPIPFERDPAYQLPVFSADGLNDFRRLVGRPEDWTWERTSLDASIDRSVGFSDTSSATIRSATAGRRAWYARALWIDPWRQRMLEGRHRFTAMVRTKDLAGEARLSVVQNPNPARLLYDVRPTAAVSSEPVTGTTGWTRLSVDFEITEPNALAVLEQVGVGQTWFDDARVAPLCDPVAAGEAPRVAFHARDDLDVARRPVDLLACEVSHPGVRSSIGKLTVAWPDCTVRLPRVALEPGRYQLVVFAGATGCPDDPPRLLVRGLPGGPFVVAFRPGATDDYAVDFVVDRCQEVAAALTLLNDGLCGPRVDKNVFVRAMTIAGPF
jgi:hypothetical protein